MKNEIINLSKKLNIDEIGFTNLECDKYLEHKYKLQELLDYKCSFQTGDLSDKMLISAKYKIYNSAVVILVSYNKFESNEIHLSSCSIGIDYHKVLKEKLNVISSYLKDKGYICDIYVDNNSLDERYLAYKAGLGFFGKNNLLINDKLGSLFFIGVLLTNAVFEYDKIIKHGCINCNKCVEVCPTHALSEKGILNSKKCLSYLTQKRDITESESKYINNCIYGCDICLNVCPYNSNKYTNNFKPIGNEIINENEFNNMTNSQFKKIYGNNACSWRGKNILKRNIEYYKNNIKNSK